MFTSLGVCSSTRVVVPVRLASGAKGVPARPRAVCVVATARIDIDTPSVSGSEISADVRYLLPSDYASMKSESNLIATVSAKAAPAPAPEISPFVAFCRANWGFFAALQTVALIGASFNGRLARKRRLEIAEINGKLRAMMAKQELAASLRNDFASEDEDEVTSEKLSQGKQALANRDFELAVSAFDEARVAANAAGIKSAELSAYKGLARALIEAGQIKAAVGELVAAVDLAVEQNDSSVYGMLGDCYTDLAELGEAGRYYDLCLAMD